MSRRHAWLVALLLAGCASLDPPGAARLEDVAGVRWHWVGLLFDAAATAVPEPARYWVEFAGQGGVVVNADCNGGVGRVALAELALGPIGLTRRLCEPRSLDARFARLLSQVRGGRLDGELLSLHAGGGELLLLRDAGARLVRFVCATGVPRDVVFGSAQAYLREGTRFRALARGRDDDADTYGDGEVTIRNSGHELVVEDRGRGRTGPCVAET